MITTRETEQRRALAIDPLIRAKYGGVSGKSASTEATNSSRSVVAASSGLVRRSRPIVECGSRRSPRRRAIRRRAPDGPARRRQARAACETANRAVRPQDCAWGLAEKIGAADRADEQRVAGKHACGSPGLSARLRRVPACARECEGNEGKVADDQPLVVFRFTGGNFNAEPGPARSRHQSIASSRAPDTKSAWIWVSIAATILRFDCARRPHAHQRRVSGR